MRSDGSDIAGWLKNSFIDFPGTVSTVLFFSGCNLRCPYCHNPEIVLDKSGERIPIKEIFDFLEKRKRVIEGVVFSGGEPTIHESLKPFAAQIRSKGLKIKLDTNGLLPEKIRSIAPDYLALDVKTTPQNYCSLLKAQYKNVGESLLESIEIVRSMNNNAEIRITISPGITDSKSIKEIGNMISGIKKVFLQPMQTKVKILNPALKELEQMSKEEMRGFRDILRKFATQCEIRGE
jgi:pyruvate formate lyase activating enzyme